MGATAPPAPTATAPPAVLKKTKKQPKQKVKKTKKQPKQKVKKTKKQPKKKELMKTCRRNFAKRFSVDQPTFLTAKFKEPMKNVARKMQVGRNLRNRKRP